MSNLSPFRLPTTLSLTACALLSFVGLALATSPGMSMQPPSLTTTQLQQLYGGDPDCTTLMINSCDEVNAQQFSDVPCGECTEDTLTEDTGGLCICCENSGNVDIAYDCTEDNDEAHGIDPNSGVSVSCGFLYTKLCQIVNGSPTCTGNQFAGSCGNVTEYSAQ